MQSIVLPSEAHFIPQLFIKNNFYNKFRKIGSGKNHSFSKPSKSLPAARCEWIGTRQHGKKIPAVKGC